MATLKAIILSVDRALVVLNLALGGTLDNFEPGLDWFRKQLDVSVKNAGDHRTGNQLHTGAARLGAGIHRAGDDSWWSGHRLSLDA